MGSGDEGASNPLVLPKHWRAVPMPGSGTHGEHALMIIQDPVRRTASALGVGAVSVAVAGYLVLLGVHGGDLAPLAWVMAGLIGVGGLMGVAYRLRTTEAWLVAPHRLLVGNVRRSDQAWRREPEHAIGLRLELYVDDGLHYDRLVAVVAPRGRHVELSRDLNSLEPLASWLATRAGLPLVDDRSTGDPQVHRRNAAP